MRRQTSSYKLKLINNTFLAFDSNKICHTYDYHYDTIALT